MKNLKSFFKNKKVLITGHTGFKGSWLSQILVLWGADVTGISLRPDTVPNLFNLLKLKNSVRKNYFSDIRNLKKTISIFRKEKPEIVFHLAAQPLVRESYDKPVYTFETNVIGTANVLEAVRNSASVHSVVIITTDKVYENREMIVPHKEEDKLGGHDPYSSSKASAEFVVDSYRKSFFNPDDFHKTHYTLVVSARAGNVIGGGDWGKDRIMTDIINAVFKHKKPIFVRNPQSIRPWQFVLEPLAGYLTLAKGLYEGRKELSGAWNFGPHVNNHLTVKTILKETLNYLGFGSYIVERDFSKHETKLLFLDSSKARLQLGWHSIISAGDALKLALDWYKNYYSGGQVIDYTNRQIKFFFK